MRIVALPPGAVDLVFELGLGGEITGRDGDGDGDGDGEWEGQGAAIVARRADPPAPDAPLLSGVPPHDHIARYVVDREALAAARPEVVLTEEVCPVCLAVCRSLSDGAVTGAAAVGGREVPLVSLTARRLEDALAPVAPVATLLGQAERGQRLLHVRGARLLALSMHVARYLVRVGGRRPAVAFVRVTPRGDLVAPGRWFPDLLDAGGGVPQLVAAGAEDVPLTPAALQAAALDLLIVGAEGPDGLEQALAAARSLDGAAGERWALKLDGLFTRPGPHLVDAVEVLLRMVFPAALGANGTPPPPERALKL